MMDKKEKKKEYMRLYNIRTKETRALKKKEYYEKNKEKNKEHTKEYQAQWYKLNKESQCEKGKEYYKTTRGKMFKRISNWKSGGILCFDWELMHHYFINQTTCEFCNVELTSDRFNTSTTKCLDHDHNINDRFNIRGVLCNKCNRKDVYK